MKALFRTLLLVAAFAPCASAGAANVTVGPPLSGSWESSQCVRDSCTFVNTGLGAAEASATSPVTGLIVSFSVVGGSTAGTYQLRTANEDDGELAFDFSRIGPPVSAVPNPGVQSYPTSLPVKAGQMIGLNVAGGASMAFTAGGRYVEWVGQVPQSGRSIGLTSWPENVGFDAVIQPAPTISELSATSGPKAGGTAVTISGADLEGASDVTFGGVPASSFEARSASRIVAVAPPSKTATSVPVVVTTLAGTGTGPRFSYLDASSAGSVSGSGTSRCVVPDLKGRRLAAAKKALAKAGCGLGKVTRRAGATAKSGRVSKQGAKAGAKLTAGAKVTVTLKPPKAARHRSPA